MEDIANPRSNHCSRVSLPGGRVIQIIEAPASRLLRNVASNLSVYE